MNRRRVASVMKRRLLDIAANTAWTSSWGNAASAINQELSPSLPAAVARSRGLWRNNDYLRRYRMLLINNVLGPAGLRLQMRMTLRDGRPNDEINSRVESAWHAWGKRGSCDVTGTLEWSDVERMCLESLARDGEMLVRKVVGRGGMKLQVLDSTLLDVNFNQLLGNGRRIFMGVEIDEMGMPHGYHLRNGGRTEFDSATLGDHIRIPADQIIHRFVAEEPGQVRGMPWCATSARRLWLVKDFEEAAAVASSNAAKRIGFFVSPTGEAPPGFADQIVSSVLDQARAAGKVLTPEEVQELAAVAEKYHTSNPGQYDTLPSGYDFRPFESDYPHTGHGEYVKACLRGAASGLGVSYVSLGNDLESVNYSSARVGIIEEREFFKWLQSWLVCALHESIFNAWLPSALLTVPQLARVDVGRLEAMLTAVSWQPRRWAGIDPVKEADAARTNLELKLTSRRRLILERGEDPDEVFAELEAEERLLGATQTAGASAQSDDEQDDDDEQQQERGALRAI